MKGRRGNNMNILAIAINFNINLFCELTCGKVKQID